MREININRQLLGIEDLLFGFGQVIQTRAGQSVIITKINAGTLPFDETQSLLQWAQNVNLAELGAMTVELQAIYNSIDALNNLEDNLVALNTLAQAINCLNNLCANLTKLQNIDTNMTKLKNIDTNMTKLQNINTNMTKLQNIDTNMLQLSSIYTNMASLQNIYTNMSSLNAINSQIIPYLSEILLVDDYAGQVASDKTTVAKDKASVAAMKLAVETIYDTFDDRFLGTKTSDPTLDNDGNPLIDGAMYFNTSVNALKVYDLGNTTWLIIPQIYLSSLLDVTLTSITTGDILTWNGSKWINTRTPSFDSIKLNGGTGTNGTATWNNAEYTYDIVLNPNVTLQVGQEDLVYCKNNSASVIANGRPVMASGTNGNSGNILVDLHDGTKANARRIVGITTEDLTANGYGFVTRNGKVRGINTTGSQYGETWVNGDILYVKATGNLTKVEPLDSQLKMPIAFVIHAHTNGTLYIRTTGIDENHDRDLISTKLNTSDVLGSFGNLSSPLLDLPLKNSLTMKAGVGSTTFTRASTATYIDRYGVLKTASIDEPRFENDGLLIEENSTNLLTYSDNMLIGYLSSRSTITLSTTELSPDGITYATEFRETTVIGSSYLYKSTTFTAGVTYTQSIFVKSINGQNFRMPGFSTSMGFEKNNEAVFDLTNGIILSDNTGTAGIESFPNGWYRCSITATCTTAITGNYAFISMLTDYKDTNYGLYLFGAQLEEKPFASSYIPTTDSAVTRAITGSSITAYGNAPSKDEGTIYCRFKLLSNYNSANTLWSLYNTNGNYIRCHINISGLLYVRSASSSGGLTSGYTSLNINQEYSVCATWKNNLMKVYIDGVLKYQQSWEGDLFNTNLPSLAGFAIGKASISSNTWIGNGNFSKFLTYDKELTPTEIALLG